MLVLKTLEYGYGIDTLIDAFALLCKRDLDLELVFADRGRGSERKITVTSNKFGAGRKIVFEGKVVHDHLPEVISSFDVFVALSRTESFGVASGGNGRGLSCCCIRCSGIHRNREIGRVRPYR